MDKVISLTYNYEIITSTASLHIRSPLIECKSNKFLPKFRGVITNILLSHILSLIHDIRMLHQKKLNQNCNWGCVLIIILGTVSKNKRGFRYCYQTVVSLWWIYNLHSQNDTLHMFECHYKISAHDNNTYNQKNSLYYCKLFTKLAEGRVFTRNKETCSSVWGYRPVITCF